MYVICKNTIYIIREKENLENGEELTGRLIQ